MLSPLELVAIAVVVVVFLLMGPKKIPEMARSLGMARKEFAQASTHPLSSVISAETDSTDHVESPQPLSSSSDDSLTDVARRLGISTEGKTKDQVSRDILERIEGQASPQA